MSGQNSERRGALCADRAAAEGEEALPVDRTPAQGGGGLRLQFSIVYMLI